jgi:hypothetical protein
MLFYSPFSIRRQVSEDVFEVLGYSPDEASMEPDKNFYAKFETFLYQRSGQNVEYISKRLERVRRLCNKRKLSFDIPYEADFIEKLFAIIGLKEIPKIHENPSFVYEINFENPTQEQFQTVIRNWRNHIEEVDNNWDDLGFKLEGEDKTLWLNKFYMSKTFDLFVDKDNDEMINTESLMKEISSRREELLEGLELLVG